MRDKRSTLIIFAIIAIQVIVAIALFAGASGKKPERESVEIAEETVQEEIIYIKEDPSRPSDPRVMQEDISVQEKVDGAEPEGGFQNVPQSHLYSPQEPVVVEEIQQQPTPIQEAPQQPTHSDGYAQPYQQR